MTDCTKCIHEQVCDQASRLMWVRMSGESECSDFKDRAKCAEMQHSKWLQHRMSVPKGKGQTYLVYGCWICHKHERKRTPYCPNCGAKMMDGDVNG